MAAESVSISATYGDGKTLDTLADLIAKRAERLNQTTEQATVATAINVLKSLRARTRVADPNANTCVLMGRRADLVPSFTQHAAKDGNTYGNLCVRVGNSHGPKYTGKFFVANPDGVKMQIRFLSCYFVRELVGEGADGVDKTNYVIVSLSEKSAEKFAREHYRRRVATYAGLAKKLLGVAMNRVSEGTAKDTAASSLMGAVLGKACSVAKMNDGFSSGNFSILIQDLLRYAVPALEGGAATVETALQKASNLTAKLINQHAAQSFDKEVKIPFETIKEGNT